MLSLSDTVFSNIKTLQHFFPSRMKKYCNDSQYWIEQLQEKVISNSFKL